jgi:hypothetical protein
MFNASKALACSFVLAIFSLPTFAQTVITAGTTTPASCDGGPRSGPPIGICKSGSYILNADMQITTGTNGIDIAGDNITLDLNGFSVYAFQANCTDGSPRGNSCTGAPGSLYGIYVTGKNVTVKNGTIRNFNGNGIFGGESSSFTDLFVHDNNGTGVQLGLGQIKNIRSNNNNGIGILLGGGIVDNAYVAWNNGIGIYGGSYTLLVSNSSVLYNTSVGVYFTYGQTNNVISYFNGGDGFNTNGFGQYVNSVAYANTGNGFDIVTAGAGGAIIGSLASGNSSYGFNLTTSSCYQNITTLGNTTGTVTGGAAYGTGTICAH